MSTAAAGGRCRRAATRSIEAGSAQWKSSRMSTMRLGGGEPLQQLADRAVGPVALVLDSCAQRRGRGAIATETRGRAPRERPRRGSPAVSVQRSRRIRRVRRRRPRRAGRGRGLRLHPSGRCDRGRRRGPRVRPVAVSCRSRPRRRSRWPGRGRRRARRARRRVGELWAASDEHRRRSRGRGRATLPSAHGVVVDSVNVSVVEYAAGAQRVVRADVLREGDRHRVVRHRRRPAGLR